MEFPADVSESESFARKILEEDINQLVTAIHSLSERIMLNTQMDRMQDEWPQVVRCEWPQLEAHVFEVRVFYDEDEDKFCIDRKVLI